LLTKYSTTNSDLNDLVKSINNAIFIKFKKVYDIQSYDSRMVSLFYKLFQNVLNSKQTKDFFFSTIRDKKSIGIARLLSKYHTTTEQKESIMEIFRHMLSNTMKCSYLPFEDCASDLQEQLVEQMAKQDFGIDFVKINKNISIN